MWGSPTWLTSNIQFRRQCTPIPRANIRVREEAFGQKNWAQSSPNLGQSRQRLVCPRMQVYTGIAEPFCIGESSMLHCSAASHKHTQGQWSCFAREPVAFSITKCLPHLLRRWKCCASLWRSRTRCPGPNSAWSLLAIHAPHEGTLPSNWISHHYVPTEFTQKMPTCKLHKGLTDHFCIQFSFYVRVVGQLLCVPQLQLMSP